MRTTLSWHRCKVFLNLKSFQNYLFDCKIVFISTVMDNEALINEIITGVKNMHTPSDCIPDDGDILNNIHVSPGRLYQDVKRKRALLTLPHHELEGIYHLTESHTPGLRFKATLQYEKGAVNDTTPKTLKKDSVQFLCAPKDVKDEINTMLKNIEEMPKEWTIVQLTPQFNIKERLNNKNDVYYTDPIHISVFNCGKGNTAPFCVTVSAPFDKIANKTIEICNEMKDIVEANTLLIRNVLVTREGFFRHYKDKKVYQDARDIINCRLRDVVKEMQWRWLKEFRCLLIGKLVDETVEKEITVAIDRFLGVDLSEMPALSDKQRAIIRCLIKGSMYLKLNERKRMVEQLFPDFTKEAQIKIVKFAQDLNDSLKLHEMKRHSILLIVDEKLDFLPWEMIDVLENHPATRMSSLHFTYALFKEHEDSIEDGLKIITNPNNGAYVVNPDSDLKQMELRMASFFQYYWSEWKRLVGVKPTPEQFEELLIGCDIFSYHGHGNGSQFFSGEKIQKIRVKAVALLFGCSSVTLTRLGPKVEMYGQHHTYVIACSPCIVGFLWTVTDIDTDTVTTGFLSRWLASKAQYHWKYINKAAWQTEAGAIKPAVHKQNVKDKSLNEPELLRALCKAKKEAKHYVTTAACVSRGLPVKIKY